MNNFFNKGQFHFDVSSRRVSFPFKCRKVIFRQSRRLKSPNFPLSMNHGHNTDFSKLINLCLVKKFSLISTPGIFQSGFILFYFFHSCCYQKPDVIMLPAHFHCEHQSKNLWLATFNALVDRLSHLRWAIARARLHTHPKILRQAFFHSPKSN